MHALHTNVLTRELRKAGTLTKVLDFGCGTGRFIEVLSRHSVRVAAADKEQTMIDAARRYAGKYADEIVCCDPAQLPFESSTFDFTLCSSVLCVTMKELIAQIIKELGRVTRAGGTLLLLEQVCDQRDLPITRYHEALSRAGFEVARSYPIRSGSSVLTKLAARSGWLPESAFPKLAAAELTLTAHAITPKSTYTEYAIVAIRGGEAKTSRSLGR
jgi:ubiquinone/menaquinone biosynthesis C-methylase UbiE